MKIKVFIPGDVAQIVIEYLHHMSSMIKCRGVSSRWRLAVENAVFFLNGRNNGSFDSQNYSHYHTSVAGLAMKLSVVNFGANLKELTVMNVSVTDADLALLSARCPVLETLVVGHSGSLQQPTVQLLRNVRRLRLTANKNLSLLTKICRAVKLQTLEVTDCKVFREENPFSICGLPELTTLDLRGCPLMSNVACLLSCRGLTSLVHGPHANDQHNHRNSEALHGPHHIEPQRLPWCNRPTRAEGQSGAPGARRSRYER
jgi:hypothetical protein